MKKTLSFLLSAAMLVSSIPVAFATNDYTQGTLVQYVGQGAEEYTITVPALLKPGAGGDVTLSGTWAESRIVTVTAEPSVTLTNSINANDQKVLNVYFDGISEKGSNVGAQTFTETVSVESIQNAIFGTWSGKFNYNVSMEDAPTKTLKYGKYTIVEDHLDDGENLRGEYLTFYEDGGVYHSLFNHTYPAGTVQYVDNKIIFPDDFVEAFLSDDGNFLYQYNTEGKLLYVFAAEGVEVGTLSTQEAYVRVSPTPAADEIPMWIEFYSDGTAMATVRTYDDHHDWNYTCENNRITYDGQPSNIEIILSYDAKTLTFKSNDAELAVYKIASEIESPIKYNTKYVETYDRDGDISDGQYYIFYEDNSICISNNTLGEMNALMLGANKTFCTEKEIFDTLDTPGSQWDISADGKTVTYKVNGVVEAVYEAEANEVAGVKFNESYVSVFGDTSASPVLVMSAIVKENGQAELYMNNVLAETAPVGYVKSYGNKLVIDGDVCVVVGDGNMILMRDSEGDIANVFVNEKYLEDYNNNQETNIRFGEKYIVVESDTSDNVGKYIKFAKNGRIETDLDLMLVAGYVYGTDTIGIILDSTDAIFEIQDEGKTVVLFEGTKFTLESEI